jgi:hypothetical protein
MTLSLCDQVTERVALGEALGELAEHAATCPTCQRLAAVSRQLGRLRRSGGPGQPGRPGQPGQPGQLGTTPHEIDPGLGFSARMTVGAQHRITVRRRRRLAAGLAATVATGAFGVFVLTRSPGAEPRVAIQAPPSPTDPDHKDDPPPAAVDADLAALVDLADVDRSSRLSARWAHIKKPLAPYQKLIKGVTP